MKNTVKQIQSRNLIISSLVWAMVMLVCSFYSEFYDNNIMLILITGFLIEFFRNISLINVLKNKEEKHIDSAE